MFFLAIPHHPYKLIVAAGLVICIAALALGATIRIEDPILVIILGVQIAYSASAALMHELFFLGMEYKYINLSIQFITVLVLYLYIIRFYRIRTVALSTAYVMAAMGVLGFLGFVLAAVGILPVLSEFQGPTWVTYNFGLTFSPAIISYDGGVFFRAAGFFDEPGTLAFYITFALLINKLYGHSRRLEWLLILSGLFTFSLAFFVTLILYMAFFYLRWKYVGRVAVAAATGVAILWYVASTRDQSELNSQVYSATLARLQPDQSGSGQLFSGDTRSVLLRAAREAFAGAPFFGNGFSAKENPRSEFYGVNMDANALWPFAAHGVIGVIIFFGAYLYWTALVFGSGRFDRIIVGSWAIVTANLLQRPDAFGGAYGYFVYIFFIYATKWRMRNADLAALNRSSGLPGSTA